MEHKCDGCRYKGEHQEMGFAPFGVCLKETNLVRAEQLYNLEYCPYICDAYANGTTDELVKVFEDMTGIAETEAFKKMVDAVQRLSQTLMDVLTPLIEKAMETFKMSWETILRCYPNKRVLHLALYHPKERVRKKNMRRIMRWIEQG